MSEECSTSGKEEKTVQIFGRKLVRIRW